VHVIGRLTAWVAVITLAPIALLARQIATQPPDGMSRGRAVFERACSSCHIGDDPDAPSPDELRGRSPQAILDSLTSGAMKYQGLALSGDQRRAVAEFITGRRVRGTVSGATAGMCAARRTPLGDPFAAAFWNGWGAALENTHFQPAEKGGVTAADLPRLRLKWAFGFPDTTSAWAQPAIAGGRVFIGSQNGTVYSLDAATGCIVWTFTAQGGVRAAISIGARRRSARAAGYAAYVADQQGFVYALDAASGRMLWTKKVDDHPLVRLTGSPALYDGRLYVPTSSYEEGGRPPGYACCTFRGSVAALDAETGTLVWKSYTIRDAPALLRAFADGSELRGPAGGAIWSAPTIDVKRREALSPGAKVLIGLGAGAAAVFVGLLIAVAAISD